jgi:hypothetical protein
VAVAPLVSNSLLSNRKKIREGLYSINTLIHSFIYINNSVGIHFILKYFHNDIVYYIMSERKFVHKHLLKINLILFSLFSFDILY